MNIIFLTILSWNLDRISVAKIRYYSEASKILYVYLEILKKKLPNAFDSLAAFLIFVSSYKDLDSIDECYYSITLFLGCIVEVECWFVCIAALIIAVPHDSLYYVAGTAVVQTVASTSQHA